MQLRMEYMRPRGHRPRFRICLTVKSPNGAATTRIALRRRNSARGNQESALPCEIRAHQGSTPALRHAARRIRVDHRLCAARRHVQARGLALQGLNRLKYIAESIGPIQILYGGKAHPHDAGGKALIQRVIQAATGLKNDIKILYLENYNMALAKLITSGVDLWLNTPQRPQEASGTSGMKPP